MFEFENLIAYQKSKLFYKEIEKLIEVSSLPDYTIKDQLKRAALSIVLNIAEGAGRFHSKDKRNFYVNARGSVNECVAVLQILSENSHITKEKYQKAYDGLEELSKIIAGLIGSQK